MSNFNVNISIEDVLNQKEQETVKFKPKTVFNEKNYCNVCSSGSITYFISHIL